MRSVIDIKGEIPNRVFVMEKLILNLPKNQQRRCAISERLCIYDSATFALSSVLSWVYAYIRMHVYISEDNHDRGDYN